MEVCSEWSRFGYEMARPHARRNAALPPAWAVFSLASRDDATVALPVRAPGATAKALDFAAREKIFCRQTLPPPQRAFP
jgi:hypothetical protein